MIKLFFRNKIVEIANLIHELWTDEELALKYFAVYLCTCIPLSAIWAYIIALDDNKGRIGLYIFYGFAFGLFTIAGLAISHFIIRSLYRWIKSNIEKAKNGIKVQPNWKK